MPDILPNVIAMGYPADKFEAMYRNPIQEVVRLLNEKHDGKYWIYNLYSYFSRIKILWV